MSYSALATRLEVESCGTPVYQEVAQPLQGQSQPHPKWAEGSSSLHTLWPRQHHLMQEELPHTGILSPRLLEATKGYPEPTALSTLQLEQH